MAEIEELKEALAEATPGLWRVEDGTDLIWGRCDDDLTTTRGMGRPIVTGVVPPRWTADDPDEDECYANARAIALAINFLRKHADRLSLSEGDGWREISSAPKSTSETTPYGEHVKGVYLLGFCPEESVHPQGCIEVIWWEPNENKGRGAWYGGGAHEVHPTHWRPLPAAPASLQKEEA